jgi:hypothetical protein
MSSSKSHEINLTRLQTSVRRMMAMCFWKNSHHWSSYPTRRKNNSTFRLRVAYFPILNWFGFNFCKYHPDAVQVFRRLPRNERFFYEVTQDRYTKFKVWCIDGKYFENVLTQLYSYPHIEIEFVVSHKLHGLVVPEPFKPLKLTFYERGKEC